MKYQTGQRNSRFLANSSESAPDQHSMPWLTSSADKRITDDLHFSELSNLDNEEEDDIGTPVHRITRVRHHKILKRVRQKLQRY